MHLTTSEDTTINKETIKRFHDLFKRVEKEWDGASTLVMDEEKQGYAVVSLEDYAAMEEDERKKIVARNSKFAMVPLTENVLEGADLRFGLKGGWWQPLTPGEKEKLLRDAGINEKRLIAKMERDNITCLAIKDLTGRLVQFNRLTMVYAYEEAPTDNEEEEKTIIETGLKGGKPRRPDAARAHQNKSKVRLAMMDAELERQGIVDAEKEVWEDFRPRGLNAEVGGEGSNSSLPPPPELFDFLGKEEAPRPLDFDFVPGGDNGGGPEDPPSGPDLLGWAKKHNKQLVAHYWKVLDGGEYLASDKASYREIDIGRTVTVEHGGVVMTTRIGDDNTGGLATYGPWYYKEEPSYSDLYPQGYIRLVEEAMFAAVRASPTREVRDDYFPSTVKFCLTRKWKIKYTADLDKIIDSYVSDPKFQADYDSLLARQVRSDIEECRIIALNRNRAHCQAMSPSIPRWVPFLGGTKLPYQYLVAIVCVVGWYLVGKGVDDLLSRVATSKKKSQQASPVRKVAKWVFSKLGLDMDLFSEAARDLVSSNRNAASSLAKSLAAWWFSFIYQRKTSPHTPDYGAKLLKYDPSKGKLVNSTASSARLNRSVTVLEPEGEFVIVSKTDKTWNGNRDDVSVGKGDIVWKNTVEIVDDCRESYETPSHRTVSSKEVTAYGLVIDKFPIVYPEVGSVKNRAGALIRRIAYSRSYNRDSVKRVINTIAKGALKDMAELAGQVPVPTIEEFLKNKQYSAEDKKYMISVAHLPLTKDDFRISEFVKDEAYVGKECLLDDESYKNRAIISRTLALVAKLGPLIHWFSEVLKLYLKALGEWRYDKDMSPAERGQFMERMWALGEDVFKMDASNFDGCLTNEWITFEKGVLFDFIASNVPVSRVQRENWTKTAAVVKGLFFQYCHARRSGDPITSPFNTFFNYCETRASGAIGGMFCGDDAIAVYPRGTKSSVVEAHFASVGVKEEVILCPSVADVEYCSGIFWPIMGCLVWGPKPGKVMAKFGHNKGNLPIKKEKQILLGTAIGMEPLCNHVPILGDLMRSVRNQLGWGGADLKPDFRQLADVYHQGARRFRPIAYDFGTVKFAAARYQCSETDIVEACEEIYKMDFSKVVVLKGDLWRRIAAIDNGLDPLDLGQGMTRWRYEEPELPVNFKGTILNNVPGLWLFGVDGGKRSENPTQELVDVAVEELALGLTGPIGVADLLTHETYNQGFSAARVAKHCFLAAIRASYPFVAFALHYGHNYLALMAENNSAVRLNRSKNTKQGAAKNAKMSSAEKTKLKEEIMASVAKREEKLRNRAQRLAVVPRMVATTRATGTVTSREAPAASAHSSCVIQCVNPFDPRCNGCRLPDMSNVGVSTVNAMLSGTQTTDSTYGTVTFAMCPMAGYCFQYPGSYTSATTWSWTGGGAASFGNYSTISAAYNAYRPVCAGYRISLAANLMTTVGTFHACWVPAKYGRSGVGNQFRENFPASISEMATFPTYRKCSLADIGVDGLIFSAPRLSRSSEIFEGFSGYDEQFNYERGFLYPWQVLVIAITGAATNQVIISYDMICRMEVLNVKTNGVTANLGVQPYSAPAMEVLYSLPSLLPTWIKESKVGQVIGRMAGKVSKYVNDNASTLNKLVGLAASLV